MKTSILRPKYGWGGRSYRTPLRPRSKPWRRRGSGTLNADFQVILPAAPGCPISSAFCAEDVGKHDANLFGWINQLCRFQNPTGPEELSPVAGRGQAAKVLEAKARERLSRNAPRMGRVGRTRRRLGTQLARAHRFWLCAWHGSSF
jgi:hypothetical protein